MHIPAPSASARAAGDGIRVEDLPDTANYVPVDEASGTQMVLPERRGQPVCAHFQKHGWCELGMHCALGHPSGRSVRFNLLGYPIRPGQRVRPPRQLQLLLLLSCVTLPRDGVGAGGE